MNQILIRAVVSTSDASASILLFGGMAFSGPDHASPKKETNQVPTNTEAPMVDVTVKKIARSASKIMRAKTIVFHVKGIAWPDLIREGNKIRFVADNVNGVTTVLRFETGISTRGFAACQ